MRRDWRVALSMVLMMASASASGCFGGDDNDIDSSDLSVDVDVLASGFFQTIELQSSVKMSVYVPYLLLDPETGFVQNSTVIDIGKGSTATLDVLVPPRSDGIYLLLGEYGRVHWPIRSESESWSTWATRGGDEGLDDARAPSGSRPTALPSTRWKFNPR